MNRSLSILFTLIMVAVVLVPAPVRAQQAGSGVTVKSDGGDIVLIPQKPGKAYLVLGIPRETKGQEAAKGLPANLSFLAGEVRLPAKQYEKIFLWEIGLGSEVDMSRQKLRVTRAKPFPPGCPPRCPELWAVVWGDNPPTELKEKP